MFFNLQYAPFQNRGLLLFFDYQRVCQNTLTDFLNNKNSYIAGWIFLFTDRHS